MVKLRYTDHDGSAEEVEAFGVTFRDGKTVEVEPEVADRLKGNRYFEVVHASAAKPKDEKPKDDKSDA